MDKTEKTETPSRLDSETQEGRSSPEIEVLYEGTQSTPIPQRTPSYIRFNSAFLSQAVPTTRIQTTVLQSPPPEQSGTVPKVRKVGNQVVHIYTKEILNTANVTTSAQRKQPEPSRSTTRVQGTPNVTAQNSVVTALNLLPSAQVVLLSNPTPLDISSINKTVPQLSQGVLTMTSSVTTSSSSFPVIQLPTVIQASPSQPTVIKKNSFPQTVIKESPLSPSVSQRNSPSSAVNTTSQGVPSVITTSSTNMTSSGFGIPSVRLSVQPPSMPQHQINQSSSNLSNSSPIGPLTPGVTELPKPKKPRAPRKKNPKKSPTAPLPVTSVQETPVTQPPNMRTTAQTGTSQYRTAMPPLINTAVPISLQGFSNLNPAVPGNMQVQMPFNMNNLMAAQTGVLIRRPIYTSQASSLSPQNTVQLSSQNQALMSLVRPQKFDVQPPPAVISSPAVQMSDSGAHAQYLQQSSSLQGTTAAMLSSSTSAYGTSFVKESEITYEGVTHLTSQQDSYSGNSVLQMRRRIVSLEELKLYQAQQLAQTQTGQLTYNCHSTQYPSQIQVQVPDPVTTDTTTFKRTNSSQPLSLQDFIELNSTNRATPVLTSVIAPTSTTVSSARSVDVEEVMRTCAPDGATAGFSDPALHTLTFYQTSENRVSTSSAQITQMTSRDQSIPELQIHGNSNMDSIIEEVISRTCRDPHIEEGTASSMSSVGTLTPGVTSERKKTPAAPRKRGNRSKKKDVQNTSGSMDSFSSTGTNSSATPLPSFCSSFQNTSSNMYPMESGSSGTSFSGVAAVANVIPPGQINPASTTEVPVKPKRKQSVRKKKIPPVVTPSPVISSTYIERPLQSQITQENLPSVIQPVPVMPPEVMPSMDLLSQFPANLYLNESNYISDQSLQNVPPEVPENFLDNLEAYFEDNPPEPGFPLDNDLVNLTLDSFALGQSYERTSIDASFPLGLSTPVDTSLPPGSSTSVQSTTVSPMEPLTSEPAKVESSQPKKPRKPYVRKPYVRKKDRVTAVSLDVTPSALEVPLQFSSPNLDHSVPPSDMSQFGTPPEPEQTRSAVDKPKKPRKPYVRKKHQNPPVDSSETSAPSEIGIPLLPENLQPLIPYTIKQKKRVSKKKVVPAPESSLDISAQIAAMLAECTSETHNISQITIQPVTPKRSNSRKKKEILPSMDVPLNVLEIQSSTGTAPQEVTPDNPNSMVKVKTPRRPKKQKAEEVPAILPSSDVLSEADAILAKINLTPHLTAERYIPASVPSGFMTSVPSYSTPLPALMPNQGNERSSVIQSTFNFHNFSSMNPLAGITVPSAWNSSWYSTEKPLNPMLPETPIQTYAPLPASAMKKTPARKRPTKKKPVEAEGRLEAPTPSADSVPSSSAFAVAAGVAGTSSTTDAINKPEPSKPAKPKRLRKKKEKQSPSLQSTSSIEVPMKLFDFVLNTPTSSPVKRSSETSSSVKSNSENITLESPCLTSPIKPIDRGLITVTPIIIQSTDEGMSQPPIINQLPPPTIPSPATPGVVVCPVKSTPSESPSMESKVDVVSDSTTLANVPEKQEVTNTAEVEDETGQKPEADVDVEDELHQSIAMAKPVRRRGRPAKYDDAHYSVKKEVTVVKKEVQPNNVQSEANKGTSVLNPGFRWVYTREELEFLYKEGSILINRNDIDLEPQEVSLWSIRDGGRGRVILEEYEPFLKESTNQWYHIAKWVQELSDGSIKKWGERTILVENPTALYKAYLPVFVMMFINNPDMSVLKYIRDKRTLPFLMDIYQISPDMRAKFEDCLRIIIFQGTDPYFINNIIHDETQQQKLLCQLRASWAAMETWIREGCYRILNSPKWRSQFWIQFMKYAKVIFSVKNINKAQPCAACMNPAHIPAKLVQFEGPVYDVRSLQAKRDDEWDDSDKPNPDLQLCFGCSSIVKDFHSLYHVRFHMLSTIQFRLETIIKSGISPELKLCPLNLADSFMSDKEWLTMMLVDFQITLSRARKDGDILDKFVPFEGTPSAETSSSRNTSPRRVGVGRPRKNSMRDSTGTEADNCSDSETSTVHDFDA